MCSKFISPCADPESFVRGGPILTGFLVVFLVDEGEEVSKYHAKRVIIGPPAKRHLNDGSTLKSGLVAL